MSWTYIFYKNENIILVDNDKNIEFFDKNLVNIILKAN